MMEKLLEQNDERTRQKDASATTSSYAIRPSNIYWKQFQRILQKLEHQINIRDTVYPYTDVSG